MVQPGDTLDKQSSIPAVSCRKGPAKPQFNPIKQDSNLFNSIKRHLKFRLCVRG